ncbi:EamA family transporter [Plantactinospora sp. CA-290183]|uniref:EamA family transporter n=1 Tax=Plantactinospora sp. CA-290183 TaxID=3240006 RepID=UPI003D94274A
MNVPLVLVGVAVVLQAGSSGFLSGRLDGTQSLLFSTVAFALATVVFTAVERVVRPGLRGNGLTLRTHLKPMAYMNVLTAVTFIGFYLSLAYVPASLAISVETAIGPLVIALANRVIRRRPGPASDYLVGSALIICSAGLALRLPSGSTDDLSTGALVIGVGLALLAGVGAAGLALLSERLGQLNVAPVTVTANRFHLTYLAALVLLALEPPTLSDVRSQVPLLLVLAVVAVVVPLYLLQVGLQRADPLKAMTLVTTMPGMTYLAQVAFGAAFDPWAFALTALITVIAVGYAHASRRSPQRAETAVREAAL